MSKKSSTNDAITDGASKRFGSLEQKLNQQKEVQEEIVIDSNSEPVKNNVKEKSKTKNKNNDKITITKMLGVINDPGQGNEKTIKNFGMTERHAMMVDLMAAIDPDKNKSEI
ncbi:MAG: hypothetical protein ACOCRX_10925, partial [Candidatus Woesearchaeota archaeon]